MEVCIDSVASAIAAEKGGAIRVELCSALLEGGLTPTVGMLKAVKRHVSIPVFVMIRPRGGDFLYSEDEVSIMIDDILALKQAGADGFVFGALTRDGYVDISVCTKLIEVARPNPITFHRAFDMGVDLVKNLETVMQLGFERLLTSGMDSTVLEGLDNLIKLVDLAKDKIIIVPGGGITERNLQKILTSSKCKEFHCSARKTLNSEMTYRNSSVFMGGVLRPPEFSISVTDEARVSNLLRLQKETLSK